MTRKARRIEMLSVLGTTEMAMTSRSKIRQGSRKKIAAIEQELDEQFDYEDGKQGLIGGVKRGSEVMHDHG